MMRKKGIVFKRALSGFMAVVLAFTTASYDVHAEEFAGGEPFGYEYEESAEEGDVSDGDISDNETTADVSENEYVEDISGAEEIADVSADGPDDSESLENSENPENSEIPDVSGADVLIPETEPVEPTEPDPFVPGYIHSPFETEPEIIILPKAGLRDAPVEEKYIPEDIAVSLRKQNPYGTCWAFSSIALAELYMNKHHGIIPDYSELHLAYFCFRPTIDPLGGTDGDKASSTGAWDFLMGGGNNEQAGLTFASWRGVASEKTVPYSKASTVASDGIDTELAYEDALHIKNFYEINIHENPEIVKKFVKENGGASLSYHSLSGTSSSTNSTVYNSTHNCYYNSNDELTSNHAVTIVGWDDTFSKYNFSQTPATNGAWLIRNSWTTGSYNDNQSYSGYFWLSYCDATISASSYVFTFEDAENYDHNYQYDGVPLNQWWTRSVNSLTMANVYTAKACDAGEVLKAVAFHTASANFTADIKIYKPSNSSKPNSGTLLASQTYSSVYPGYHTVDLDNQPELEPGSKFSVVITITASGNAKVSCEVGDYYGFITHADAGESFWSADGGNSWSDFGTDKGGNLRIKAFTCDNTDGTEITGIAFKDDISNTGVTLSIGDEYAVKTETTPYQLSNSKLIWESSAEDVATVSASGRVRAVGTGTAVITASAPSGANCSFTVSVLNVPDIHLNMEDNLWDDNYLERGTTAQFKVYTADDKDVTDRVTFSVSDPAIISIDDSGLVTGLKAGTATVYAQLYTKTASFEIRVIAVSPDVTAVVAKDSTVTLTWPATGAFQYEVKVFIGNDQEGETVTIPAVEGKTTYTHTDTTYKDTEDSKKLYYYVWACEYVGSGTNSWTKTSNYDVAYVGPTYDVTYYLNGGTNDPNNPSYVRKGEWPRGLSFPTPPTGYHFDGWYTTPDFQAGTRIYQLDEFKPYTIYAKYYPIYYYVQIDGNGATMHVTGRYTLSYDQDWTIPLNSEVFKLARTGWEFNGWNTRANGTGNSYEDGATVRNLTTQSGETVRLYAQWGAKKYNITFDANGGTAVDTVKKLAYGDQYGTLPATTREGYDFAGWHTAKTGGTRIVEESTLAVQSDQILYARWTPKSYAVSFEDPEGHTTSESKTVTYTSTYGTLPAPTRTGYNFAGWYLGETKITASSTVNTAGDHTLTARWTPKTPKVTFNGNGGTVLITSMTVEYDARYDKNGALPEPTRSNYTFEGWYTQAEGGVRIKDETKVETETNHTLYAHWKGVVSDVSFNLMCDEEELKPSSPEIKTVKVEYGKTYGDAMYDEVTSAGGLKTPERVGYTFVGWYTSADYTTRITDASLVNITSDITLYAKWDVALIAVTFVPGNGEESVIESLVYGGFYELPETPVKRGYSFAGWYTKAYDPGNPDDKGELKTESVRLTNPEAHTLYGHWTAKEYTISLADEDGTLIKTVAAKFDAPVSEEITAPAKDGYVFAGWSLTGNPDDVIDIAALKLKYDYDSNITLKACYVPKTDIKVGFDPNGGALAATEWTVTYKTPYESDGRVLPVPEKEHFEFAGWFTKPEGEEGALLISSGSIVNIGEDHTLYAHWALKKYNVVFKLEGGNFYKKAGDTDESAALETVAYKVTYNTALNTVLDVAVPDPVKPKFSFAGWYDAPVGGSEFNFSTPITGDTYIYAHWTQTDENVDFDGIAYKVVAPEAIIHRQPGDASEGLTFSGTARIELKSATPGAKIYFIANPDEEELTADYYAYLTDKDKQNRLTLYTDELNPAYISVADGLNPDTQVICIRAIAVKEGYATSDAAVFNFTLTDSREEWGDITDEDKVSRFENNLASVPRGMWISGIPGSITFTGANITFPDMKVYDAKKLLTLGTDYTVAYKNNKNVGTATVTVTGKGNYTGTFTQTFAITQKNLADDDVIAKDIKLAFNGKVQLAAPSITYGTVTLKSGTDFTALYPHTNTRDREGENAYSADAFKVSGDYVVTVTGKGNYTGTLTYTETIYASGVKSANALTVTATPNKKAYTGEAIEPAVTVKDGTKVLKGIKAADYEALSAEEKATYDYTYRFFDNVAVGKARILITSVNSAYVGEKEAAFEITGTNLANAKVLNGATAQQTYQYNGTEIRPAVGSENGVNLYFAASGTVARKDLVYDAAHPDSEDNDYFVTYNSNVKVAGKGSAAGDGKIILTGNPKKGYIGTKTVIYKIKAVNLANDAKETTPLITVRDGGDADFSNPANHAYPYTKSAVTPEPKVWFTDGDGAKVLLTKGVDYTLSYANNTAINDGSNVKKLPTVKITGKGNFTGVRAVDYFSIVTSGTEGADLALMNIKISAADVTYKNAKKNYTTTVVITDANNKALVAGTDYDKTFEYKLAEEVQFSDGKVYPAGYVLGSTDTVPAGTRIKVKVTAKGSYAGYISTEYRVVGADISKATVTIANQYYTGFEIRPDKTKLNVVVNKISLSAEDYEITGYANNINKGTGQIFIKGVGNYGGTKTVNFKIITKPMGYTVVFHGNGSTSGSMNAQTIGANKQAALTANKFKRTGFTFAGWTTEPNGTGTAYTDKEIVSNPGTESAIVLNLYAVWTPAEYTITYHMGGGRNNPLNTDCPSENAKARYGKKTDGTLYYTAATASFKLEAPLRENWPAGYQFEGFYKESTYKTRIASINRGTTGNIDVYAKWVPYSYTVSFDGNGATSGTMDNEAFSYGIVKALNVNKFKKTGSVFMGWALDKAQADAGVVAITDKSAVDERAFGLTPQNNISAKKKLYAVWRDIFTVEFNAAGGTLPATTEADTGLNGIYGDLYEYTYGAAYKLPTPVRAGYAFAGWYTDKAFKTKLTGIAKTKSGNIVLYAKWTPFKYTVSFNGNGHSGGRTANKVLTCGTPGTLTANGYIRKGYKFTGWNFAANGTGTGYTDLDVYDFVPEKNNQTVTLYAQWTPVDYKITYVRNGGSLNPDYANYISTYEFNHDGGYNLPTPSRAGFKFVGWFKDAAFKTKVARIAKTDFGDLTLYAKWSMKYTVSFDANAADGGTGTMTAQTIAYETSTALKGNTFKNSNGKAFMGWALSAEDAAAGIVKFTNAQKLQHPDISLMTYNDSTGAYEMKLYAVWKGKFSVEFNTNGGTLPEHAKVTETTKLTYVSGTHYEYSYGKAYKLPTPARDGFTFAGWYEDAALKKKVNSIAATATGDKVLYAKYTGLKYNVAFNSDAPLDITGGANRKVTGSTAKQSIVFMTPTKLRANGFKLSGYSFIGWSTKDYATRLSEYMSAAGETDEAVARLAYDLDPSADVEYTNAESIRDILLSGETTPVYAKEYVLYAVWKKDVYVITYQNMGGIDNPNVITYTVDDEVILKEPEKMGDTFLGWYSNAKFSSKVVKIAKGSTGNRSLYAKFANNKYTINYVLNDSDGPAAILDSSNVGYITTYDMSADSGYILASATREGYDFAGWYTDKKLTKPAGPIIDSPSVDMTVYAKWVKKD